MGHPFNVYTIINIYTEILSNSRATQIYWMENNPDGQLLKVLVFLFLYLESKQVIILWKVSKRIGKTRKLIFSFITNFTWSLSTLTNHHRYLLPLQISDEKTQHSWATCVTTSDETTKFKKLMLKQESASSHGTDLWRKNPALLSHVCNYIRRNNQIQKTNVEARISILAWYRSLTKKPSTLEPRV